MAPSEFRDRGIIIIGASSAGAEPARYIMTSTVVDATLIGPTVPADSSFEDDYTTITSTARTYEEDFYKLTYKNLDFYAGEKRLKREEKEEIMEGWFSRKPELKPIITRPDLRLRGVRLDGRGWA